MAFYQSDKNNIFRKFWKYFKKQSTKVSRDTPYLIIAQLFYGNGNDTQGIYEETCMLTAKHIMNKDVITVTKDTPIFQSMELIVKHRITGIPVVENDMSVVGMISEKDLLHLFHNQQDLEEKTVDDFMTQPVMSFDENENMLDVCNLLAKQIFRRVPITSEGKLVRIISRADIIEHIVKTKQSANNIPEQASAHQTHSN